VIIRPLTSPSLPSALSAKLASSHVSPESIQDAFENLREHLAARSIELPLPSATALQSLDFDTVEEPQGTQLSDFMTPANQGYSVMGAQPKPGFSKDWEPEIDPELKGKMIRKFRANPTDEFSAVVKDGKVYGYVLMWNQHDEGEIAVFNELGHLLGKDHWTEP
jgi:hypothetical protein